MSANIRPARAEDLEAMIELARRSWLSAFAQTAPMTLIDWWAGSGRTRRLYEAEWQEMFVLESGTSIAGLVQPKGDEVNGLWVHPRMQSRGVGATLLAFAENRIRDAGHSIVWLICSGMNQRAMSFYRRCGYRETERTTRRHESGELVEDVRMEKHFLA